MATNITQRRAPGSVQPFVTLNPAPVTNANRAPTAFDNYEPSTIWIQARDVAGAPVNQIWILASTQDAVANWVQVVGNGGDATFTNITVTNDATIGGSIFLPITSAGGADGVIYVGGVRFMSDFGTRNTFLGSGSGNFTVTGINITGIGNSSVPAITTAVNVTAVGAFSGLNITSAEQSTLIGTSAGRALISGVNNTLVGSSSGVLITIGERNTAIGWRSLEQLIDGNNNIAIGSQAGSGYIGTETSNICIDNFGVPGDNNTIRLGTSGAHLNTFIAGNVDAELNVIATQALFAQGDPGVGGLGETGITNVVNTTQGAGALTLLSTNGNSGTNTGFMKFYVNGVAVFVPYFANIAP